MITIEKIQEQYLKEKKFSYMNPMVANIDYVKWLETELISVKKQLPINGVVKSLPTIDSIIVEPLKDYLEKTGNFTKDQSELISKKFYNYVDDYGIDLGI